LELGFRRAMTTPPAACVGGRTGAATVARAVRVRWPRSARPARWRGSPGSRRSTSGASKSLAPCAGDGHGADRRRYDVAAVRTGTRASADARASTTTTPRTGRAGHRAERREAGPHTVGHGTIMHSPCRPPPQK